MKRALILVLLVGCAHAPKKAPPPKFGASLLFPGGGSAASGGGGLTNAELRAVAVPVSGTVTANQGTAAAGSGAWPVTVTEDTTNTIVKPADAANKAIRVNVVAGGAAGGTSSSFGAAIPGTGTAAGASDGTNMQLPRVFDGDTGAGTQYVTGAILRKGASGGTVEAGTSADPLRVDPTGSTTQPVSGTVTANAGTNLNTSALALDATLTGGTARTKITDGTSNAAVKAATIAPVNTDPALVVAFSPNSPTIGVQGVKTNNLNTPNSTNLGALTGVATAAAPSYTEGLQVSSSLLLNGNQRNDVTSINGVAPLMGNGATGTGSQRVTIASDNTAFSVNAAGTKTNNNAAPGATNLGSIGALANAAAPLWTEGNLVLHSVLLNGNQRNDTTSINGVTPLMGNGVTGTGSQRVTIASDNTAFAVNATLQTGANTIGALSANQSVNVSQISANATLVGNGVTGAGSQRVTIASDNTAFPISNVATIGTSITPGTAAANLGKAEDAAHASGDTGVTTLAVRNDTGTVLTTTNGDYSPIAVDDTGTQFVRQGGANRWSYHENSSSALTDTTVKAACGAGLFSYIDSFTVSTGAATALNAFIEDSTTTTILGPYYLEAVAGRGFSVSYPGGKKQTNSNTLISITTSAAIAHSVDITGFCAP